MNLGTEFNDVGHWESYDEVKTYWNNKMLPVVSLTDHTFLCKSEDTSFKIVYYETTIVTYNSDGSIKLDYANYKTIMTKRRMNFYTPKGFKIIQRQKEWYLVPMWMADVIAQTGIGEKEIKNSVWGHAKQFNECGECVISAEEMLLYALGKVQA